MSVRLAREQDTTKLLRLLENGGQVWSQSSLETKMADRNTVVVVHATALALDGYLFVRRYLREGKVAFAFGPMGGPIGPVTDANRYQSWVLATAEMGILADKEMTKRFGYEEGLMYFMRRTGGGELGEHSMAQFQHQPWDGKTGWRDEGGARRYVRGRGDLLAQAKAIVEAD